MNNLLIFFAIPLATIILSSIFETLIRCPIKVGGIAFSIFLIIAFALGGTADLIVAAIVYTILAFLSAFITMLIQNRIEENNSSNSCNSCGNNGCGCNNNTTNTITNSCYFRR